MRVAGVADGANRLAAPRTALLAAVNHSGDSDSTGSSTDLLNTLWNDHGNVPREWRDRYPRLVATNPSRQ